MAAEIANTTMKWRPASEMTASGSVDLQILDDGDRVTIGRAPSSCANPDLSSQRPLSGIG